MPDHSTAGVTMGFQSGGGRIMVSLNLWWAFKIMITTMQKSFTEISFVYTELNDSLII